MSCSSLDVVKETNNVGVRRVKLMPWSEWLEPKEEEVADDVLVVMVEPGKKVVIVQLADWVVSPVETSHDIADSELLLGVLE